MPVKTVELQFVPTVKRRRVPSQQKTWRRTSVPDENVMTDGEIRQMISEAQAQADAGHIHTTEEVRQRLERRLGYEVRG